MEKIMVRLTEDEVRNSAGGILGFTVIGNHGEMINVENDKVVLCQDLVQVKMRNFSPF